MKEKRRKRPTTYFIKMPLNQPYLPVNKSLYEETESRKENVLGRGLVVQPAVCLFINLQHCRLIIPGSGACLLSDQRESEVI